LDQFEEGVRLSRRKRTLPFATADGPEPRVSINNAAWHQLEAALGQPIPDDLRHELVAMTDNFLSFAVFESTAEPLEGSKARLKSLNDVATAFWRTLGLRENSQAAFYADHLISQHFHDSRIGARDKLHALKTLMTSFVVACQAAQQEMDLGNLADHQKGEGWNLWIRNVTKACGERGLPVTARKDTDKNVHMKASPFVYFIAHFQECFPKEYRRGRHSLDALAVAIVRARRVANARTSTPNKTRLA
jgi:hypothetical protein